MESKPLPPIVAAVIYYRPKVEDVSRLVASLRGRVAGAVFLDGPYEGVSKSVKRIRKVDEAIIETARRDDPGAPALELYMGEARVWADEPEKRTMAARIAYSIWGGECPYLLVIDSDEELLGPIEIPSPGNLGVAQIIDPHKESGGATMIRLHYLTPEITWGPSHFEVVNGGIRYATPHAGFDLPHHFAIRHYGEPVKRDKAYQRYNDRERMRREAMGRHGEGELAFPSWAYETRAETIYGSVTPPPR